MAGETTPPRRLPIWLTRGLIALVALGSANIVAEAIHAVRAPDATDYISVATGADVVRMGSRCLYCFATQAAVQDRLLAGHWSTLGTDPFRNPPLVAWAMQPLANLSLGWGAAILEAVSVLAVAWSAYLLVTLMGNHRGRLRVLLAASAVTLFPGGETFMYVQWDAILLLAAVAALWAVERGRPWTSGLLLSVLLAKPQLVWLVVPVLFAIGAWRELGGFAVGAAVWLASGIAIVGVAWPVQWATAASWDAYLEASTTGLPGIADYITSSVTAGTVTAIVVALAFSIFVWTRREWLRRHRVAAIAIGLAVSLLAAPHVYSPDFLLLSILLVVWANRAPAGAIAGLAALDIAYLIELTLPTKTGHLQAVALVGVVLGTAVSLRRRLASSEDAATAAGSSLAPSG